MISVKNKLSKEQLNESLMEIKKAVLYFGTQTALSSRLGISPQNISEMKKGIRLIPIHHALKIDKITNGKVKFYSLRPDQNLI